MLGATFKNRGRAYRCKACGKIDRKGRMEGHVLKVHIPDERVPFLCTLCNFRCQDATTLMSHLTQYARHREAESKCGNPLDYVSILRKSVSPEFVGDAHMAALSKEESGQWYARHSITANENIFEDEEEDTFLSNVRVLPGWMGPVSGKASSLQMRREPASPVGYTPAHQEPIRTMTTPKPVSGAVQTDRGQHAAGLTAMLQQVSNNQFQPPQATHSSLGEFRTPCLDEMEHTTFLQDLIRVDMNDPMLNINESVINSAITKEPAESSAVPSTSDAHQKDETPPTKRPRIDVSPPSAIVDAIDRNGRRIAEAMDANTRAIRQQGKSFVDMVAEFRRIERKLTLLTRTEEKENVVTVPLLKSVVNIPKRK